MVTCKDESNILEDAFSIYTVLFRVYLVFVVEKKSIFICVLKFILICTYVRDDYKPITQYQSIGQSSPNQSSSPHDLLKTPLSLSCKRIFYEFD